MAAGPVIYAQGLFGERVRSYAGWTKLVPLGMLERLSKHLPAKRIWQGDISCGEAVAELRVIGGPPDNKELPVWVRKLPEHDPDCLVISNNLAFSSARAGKLRGRLLAANLIARLLPDLARERRLHGDRLSVALAVPAWEEPVWLATIEPIVRSVTLLRSKPFGSRPLGITGLAARQLSYEIGRLDVHVLIVAQECLGHVQSLALRRGTIVIRTDGVPCSYLPGCISVAIGPKGLSVPTEILADSADVMPLAETIIFSAYPDGAQVRQTVLKARQAALVGRAWDWSGWRCDWSIAEISEADVEKAYAGNSNL